MTQQFTELLKDMFPEDREKVIDLEAEILVRKIKKALEQASFNSL